MEHNYQIPTPLDYVDKLLDIAGYNQNLYGKTVLENSCGEGNVLVEIVRRYITDCKKHGMRNLQIKEGIERDIWAYEIDKKCIDICRQRLNKLASDEDLEIIHWNLINADYLFNDEDKYFFIAGNPPFITYHNISLDMRNKMKAKFKSCMKGRFDYCYAFIEKSIASLEEGGSMAYIIPFSVFRNEYAQAIRDIIKTDLTDVYDLSGTDVFYNVTASCAIIKINKGCDSLFFHYHKSFDYKNELIKKTDLSEKWFFESKKDGKRFGDFFKVQNSVATLCNEAFVICNYVENGDFIITGGNRIEKSILRDASSTKSYKSGRKDKIIFPYIAYKDGYKRIDSATIRTKYPEAFKYLCLFKDKLLLRKVNTGVKWYEYGRTQALSSLYGEKLIIPMIITTKVTAYVAGCDAVPYAGYFIKPKENSPYSIADAKRILENQRFYYYVQNVGTPTTKTSYRISVREIENYKF